MQTAATGTVRWLRGLLLASVVVLLEVALMRYAGSPTELLATLGHATAPSADPVAVILAAMAAAAELVGCYLLVTVLLRMAAALPGLAGALARQASDLVTIPWSGAPLTAPSGGPAAASRRWARHARPCRSRRDHQSPAGRGCGSPHGPRRRYRIDGRSRPHRRRPRG